MTPPQVTKAVADLDDNELAAERSRCNAEWRAYLAAMDRPNSVMAGSGMGELRERIAEIEAELSRRGGR